jgi:peptidoglycan/LPS O-acetylase OafA/YrhL
VLWFGLRYLIVLALTLAVAAASFYLVEQPLIRVSRRMRGFRARRMQMPERASP